GHARWFIAARPPASAIASSREGIRDGTLETMMQIPCKGWFVTCGLAALIAAAFVGRPEPARAQFGISIGGFPIGINIHGYRGYRGGRRHRGSRGGGRGAPQADDSRPGKPDKVVAGAGAPSSTEQTKVLQKIASSPTVTDVGSTKDL